MRDIHVCSILHLGRPQDFIVFIWTLPTILESEAYFSPTISQAFRRPTDMLSLFPTLAIVSHAMLLFLCTLFLYAGVCVSRWESEGLEVNHRPIPIFVIWVWVVQWSELAMSWASRVESSNRTFYQFSLWEFFLSLFLKKATCSEWLFLPCWRSLLPCGWECRLPWEREKKWTTTSHSVQIYVSTLT